MDSKHAPQLDLPSQSAKLGSYDYNSHDRSIIEQRRRWPVRRFLASALLALLAYKILIVGFRTPYMVLIDTDQHPLPAASSSAPPSSTPSSSHGPARSTLHWLPCPGIHTTNPRFQCANLSVPLSYTSHALGHSDTRTASIAITRYLASGRSRTSNPSHTDDKDIGTVIFNPGGPGGSGTASTYRFGPGLDTVLRGRYDVLGFDPRGVNLTLPRVQCLQDADREALARILGVTAPSLRPEQDVGVWDAFAEVLAGGCAREDGEVGDEDGVRSPLDSREVFEWGYTSLASQDGTMEGLFEICDRVGRERCAIAGGARETVMGVLERLYERPIAVNDDAGNVGMVTGYNYRSFLYGTLYRPYAWPRFASITADLAQGNGSSFLEATGPGDFAIADVTSAVLCTDAAPATNYTLKEWAAYLEDMTTKSFVGGAQRALDTLPCRHWRAEPSERWEGEFGDLELDTPVLVLANSFDPATPLDSARRLVWRMGSRNARLLEQRSYGHCSISSVSSCTWNAVLGYLLDGELPYAGKTCEVDAGNFTGYFPEVHDRVEGGVVVEGELGAEAEALRTLQAELARFLPVG